MRLEDTMASSVRTLTGQLVELNATQSTGCSVPTRGNMVPSSAERSPQTSRNDLRYLLSWSSHLLPPLLVEGHHGDEGVRSA